MSVCMSAVLAGISEVLSKYTGKYVENLSYYENNIFILFWITYIICSFMSAA